MRKLKIILTGLMVTQLSFADDCLKKRGILDIGSGSTKAKVAVVDICLQKIVSIVMEEQTKKVSYAADLQEQKLNNQNGFSDNIQIQGEKAIRELLALGNQFAEGIDWRGFATSAFRVSNNGAEVLAKFSKSLQIPLVLLDQKMEGEFGFAAGIQVSKRKNSKRTIVWDIGGGSQQFSYFKKRKVEVIRLEGEASEAFKELLIGSVKEVNDKKLKTPNPLGIENIEKSEVLAQEIAKKVRLPFAPKEVIGIGGVHSKSIMTAIGQKEVYNAGDIASALPLLASKTDEELKDKYAESLVSNAILVRGFLTQLNLAEVRVSSFGTADGALVHPNFWK